MISLLFSQYNFHESWANATVRHYIQPTHKVTIIPFSFDERIYDQETWDKAYSNNGKYYHGIIKPFLEYGVLETNITWVNYFMDQEDQVKEKINKSNILFLTGGSPTHTMERLKKLNLTETIETYQGILIGVSAGAMVQLSNYHISPDTNEEVFSYQNGLNRLTDFDIEVHYKRTELEDGYITKVLKEKVETLYAITDQGGLIVDQGEITLLGDVCVFCI